MANFDAFEYMANCAEPNTHKDNAVKLYRRSDDPHYFAPFSNVTCALVAAVGILAILWLA